MFAFASWDDAAGRLTLARDRIGKKPLYYHDDGRFLAFSSSLAALRKAVSHAPEIDPAAVEAYLSLGYVPAPLTILKGFRKLRAAECITFEKGEAKADIFWSLADEPEPSRAGSGSPWTGSTCCSSDRWPCGSGATCRSASI